MSPKTTIKRLLRKAGYDIFSVPREASETHSGYAYSLIQPRATLSPWLADKQFMASFAIVQDHTLVDIYRLFELWSEVWETAKIGVWRGGSGCLMAHREQLLGGSGIVHLCDTFAGVVKAGKEDSGYKGGEHKDTDVSFVKRLESALAITNTKILVGIFPDATGAQLTSRRVRLLHIDVDVYRSAKDCVEYLWDRIPSGGVIVFDDYGFVGCEGVTRYVDELKASNDVLFVHNVNGHAIIIKR